MTRTTGGLYYGWWIVAASFSILLFTVGIGLYAPPVFLVPLQDHFGWSRAAVAGGSAVGALTAGGVAPLVGGGVEIGRGRNSARLGLNYVDGLKFERADLPNGSFSEVDGSDLSVYAAYQYSFGAN